MLGGGGAVSFTGTRGVKLRMVLRSDFTRFKSNDSHNRPINHCANYMFTKKGKKHIKEQRRL